MFFAIPELKNIEHPVLFDYTEWAELEYYKNGRLDTATCEIQENIWDFKRRFEIRMNNIQFEKK
jgi:hypothetical protein